MYPATPPWKTGQAPLTVLLLLIALSVGVRPIKAADKPKNSNNEDPQTSLCLDPSSLQEGTKSNGITDPANPDHFTKSLTSTNNFINFCAGAKLTNGQQFEEESCNPTPMGFIPAKKNMPSVRIIEPSRTIKIKANEPFDVVIAAKNIQLGFFTAPATTYFIAPQQLNKKGHIKGHLHVVIQLVDRKGPLPPQQVMFFKGINDRLSGGKVHTTVDKGLPDGIYRVATMVSAMNHQLVSLGVAKRGIVDDAIYVTVGTGVASKETIALAGAGSATAASATNPGATHEKPKKHSNKKVCRASKTKNNSSRRRL